jgi:cytochrome b pre-mRNA-processing protein 3
MLHIYLLTVRFRAFPAESSKSWQQHLLDHFFFDAEDRMVRLHALNMKGARSKYLKDLFIQYRGAVAAYDEGLIKNDAVLATAVWRNIYGADEKVDVRALGEIVSYMRRCASKLDQVEDEVLAMGSVKFGNIGREKTLVMERSKLLDEPFVAGDSDPVEPPKEA